MASQFLILPMMEGEIEGLSLFSLKDKKHYNLDALQNLRGVRCVGSCHGWLAFLDHNSNPFLLNPFSTFRIHLPPKQTLPRRQNYDPTITKLVLSSHAATVVVMYTLGLQTKIAFCRQGDEEWRLCRQGDEEWRSLDCRRETYYDVVCCDRTNTLFALAPGPWVESWDLTQTTPTRTMIVQDCCPASLGLADQTFPTHLYSSQWYLAVSPVGEIYLTVRYIGEFVRHDGEVVVEGDTLTDEAAEPLVCPYKTVEFRVFKLVEGREWVDVDCLNELALFVGGNQSVMVSSVGLKGNSIYFTDDYWERMEEDYSYGGHDLGVFRMEDGRIEGVVEDQLQRIHPPPFWITLPFSLPSSHLLSG